ncbi:hypothetical protein D9M68_680860 [compost metagenome]
MDDLEVVLAPIPDVHQGVVQRRAIIALEAVDVAQRLGSVIDIRRDDAVEQTRKFAVGQVHPIERLELGTEVSFQRCAVTNVRAVGVLKLAELCDQIQLDLAFCGGHRLVPDINVPLYMEAVPLAHGWGHFRHLFV